MFGVYEVSIVSCQVLICTVGMLTDLGGKSNEKNINLYFIYLHACLCHNGSGGNVGV